jgi:rhamnosyltransferase
MSLEIDELVSIVIPTKNAGDRLRDVLAAIRSQHTSRSVEIVAFDSGSTDGTLDTLREHEVRLTEIPPSEFDHGRTRNRAIAASRGAFVVLLAQDAVPSGDGWLEALLAPFEDRQVAGSYARQVPHPDADVLTRRHVETWVTSSPEGRAQRLPEGTSLLQMHPRERHRLCIFDDVCSAIRRSVWQHIPYEATYFAEDLEWGKKVLEAGWTLVYEPRAVVVHSHDRSVWYEYRRNHLCHRRLYDLFELRTVPRFRDVIRNTLRGTRRDASFVWRFMSLLIRLPLLLLLSNLAQWRGAADEQHDRPLRMPKGV